jgi:uncharacterized cupredoxin-like copper-binding protein
MAWLIVMLALLIPAARAQSDVDWSQAQQVNVLMVDDRFMPDQLTFHHGVPYRLLLENDGKDVHEFTAPAFFADAVVCDPGFLSQDGKEIVVQPGGVVEVELMPVHPGTFKLICANHDWDGMVGQITVD